MICKGAHVHDQVLVAEGRAALGLPDFLRLPLLQLADDKLHLLRREKLALLHVDDAARRGGREQEIGLAAEKRRDL
jgi:hypothetical protein